MPYADVAAQLKDLPEPLQANTDRARLNRAFAAAQTGTRTRPISLRDAQKDRARASADADKKSLVMRKREKRPMELASAGYVADYTLSAGSYTNWVIKSDETVY